MEGAEVLGSKNWLLSGAHPLSGAYFCFIHYTMTTPERPMLLPPDPLLTGLLGVVQRKAPELLDGDWLDAGCGEGRNARYLARLGLRVTGVDFSDDELERARELAASDDIPTDMLHFDRQSIANLSYADGLFDGVICSQVLHMISRGKHGTALASLQRVTKLGGVHIVSGYIAESKKGNGNYFLKGELWRFYDNAGWLVMDYREEKPLATPFGSGEIQWAHGSIVALRR